jgi:CSLREA domain-containing protein
VEITVRRFAVLVFVAMLIAPASARATEFVVTKTADTLDGACDDDCSLREAVIASHTGPGHVITIPAGIYRLTREPAPTDPEDGTEGSLVINRPVTINGTGKDETIIDARPSEGAEGIDRVLIVVPLGDATITGVTLRGGRVATGSPRNSTGGIGGGVWVQRGAGSGAVTFVDSAITDNSASNSGGGILVQKVVFDDGEDDLVLIRTDVLRNRATDENLGQGGGISNQHANVHVIDSTIDGNIASTAGGGVHSSEAQSQLDTNLVISGSTISNNVAGLTGTGGATLIGGSGGGIYNTGGAMDVENSTISNNEARPGTLPLPSGQGGGVHNTSLVGNPETTQLTNCTVAYNVAEVGSQLFAGIVTSGLLMTNTLIVGEPGGDPNCPTTVPGGLGMVSLGGNISSDDSICNLKPDELGDQVGVTDTGLAAALADNGGETLTLSIPENSPAVGAGLAINCPEIDQRGFDRPSPCAVGAFEPVEATPSECGEASDVSGNLRAGLGESRLITASDALIVLRAATGAAQCPLCVCDVNDSSGITASDALTVLRYAVGQPVTLDCPPCA